jgi:spherulation-specific family 4 protein
VSVLLPLYVYPADDPGAWAGVATCGRDVTVVVNVHNGPGSTYDPAYGYATAALAATRVPMLGYVDLGYAQRSLDAVHADIAAWRWYPVGGIFLDQAPSDAAALGWVGQAASAVHGRVVLNPGTRPDPRYAALADLVCTYEGPWPRYRATPAEPDWPNAAHLVYDVPPEDLAAATRRLYRRVACGLVTDLAGVNPYRGLPAPLRAAPATAPATAPGAVPGAVPGARSPRGDRAPVHRDAS